MNVSIQLPDEIIDAIVSRVTAQVLEALDHEPRQRLLPIADAASATPSPPTKDRPRARERFSRVGASAALDRRLCRAHLPRLPRAHPREEYRRDLESHALPFFRRMRLAEIEPQHIKTWRRGHADQGLAAGTIRNVFAPLQAMLADVAEDGLIRSNPAAGVRVPASDKPADVRPKVLTEHEVEALIEQIPAEHRLLVRVVAETGVRISEALAWRWEDFDGQRLRVRRRLYLGDTADPKSSYGKRAIPLRKSTAQAL